MSTEHNGQVEDDFMSDRAHAECSCGWVGPDRVLAAQASQDLFDHFREVAES